MSPRAPVWVHLWVPCVSHVHRLAMQSSHPSCPKHSTQAWDAAPGCSTGALPLNSWGCSPRCPTAGAAASFVSFEAGERGKKKTQQKKNPSSLAFVLNSDQLLTGIVPPPHFLHFLPTQSTLLGPSFQISDVDDMNISASSGADRKSCRLSSEKQNLGELQGGLRAGAGGCEHSQLRERGWDSQFSELILHAIKLLLSFLPGRQVLQQGRYGGPQAPTGWTKASPLSYFPFFFCS